MFVLVLIGVFVYVISWFVYRTYFFFPRIELESLKGRRVIITGASRGIGEQLAYEYSRYQCRLLLAARSVDVLNTRVAEECRRLGAERVECLRFDASKEEDCRQLIERAKDCYGGVDILVLNHTASVYRPFFESQLTENVEQMKNLMQTNFFGYFHSGKEEEEEQLRKRRLCLFSDVRPSFSPSFGDTRTTFSNHRCLLPGWNLSPAEDHHLRLATVLLCSSSSPFDFPGTSKHAIQGFFLNLARELRVSDGQVTTTLAVLGLIGTEQALRETEKRLHFLAADVRKTAQAILAAGVYGQSRLFYPYFFAFVPPLYYLFSPIFELLARLGN